MSYNEVSLIQLLKIMPGAGETRAAQFIGPLNAAMREFAIDTPKRQAAFLAQIGHESGSLRYVREIADGSAYNGRVSLGNTRPEAIAIASRNDSSPGPFFKGRGLIQITGFDNYRECGRALFNDENTLTHNPSLLERADMACRSAAWYWDSRSLNSFADAGDFETITRKINGGLNGQADRLAYYQRAQQALAEPSGGDATASAPFPVKPEEGKKVMAPFILAALPSLIQSAPSLIRLFGNGGEQAEKNAKAAEAVVEIAKAVTDQPTAEGAVNALQAKPGLAQDYAKAVEAQWYLLVGEAGGGGISGAREANKEFLRPEAKPFWLAPAFWISIIMMSMVFMLLVDVFYVHPDGYDGNLKTQIVTAVLLIIGMVAGYWLGTSAGSERKTELMSR